MKGTIVSFVDVILLFAVTLIVLIAVSELKGGAGVSEVAAEREYVILRSDTKVSVTAVGEPSAHGSPQVLPLPTGKTVVFFAGPPIKPEGEAGGGEESGDGVEAEGSGKVETAIYDISKTPSLKVTNHEGATLWNGSTATSKVVECKWLTLRFK